MPEDSTKPLQLFQVRLTEAEKRRIKTLAVSQGLTLRQATVQAYEAWADQLPSPASTTGPGRGASAGTDLEKPGQSKRGSQHQTTPRQEQRPPDEGLTARGDLVPGHEDSSRAWLRRASQLDWSKCPAVESAQGKSGKKIWVLRGTNAPLAQVVQSVADGHPLLEIAEVYELALLQLVAVLQFAAEGAAAGSPAGG